MKSTGIVRRIDELGRIVVPKELRKTFGIKEKDPIEIFVDEERIILKKYTNDMACLLTGEIRDDNLVLGNGKLVLSRQAAEEIHDEIEKSLYQNK